MSGRGSGDEGRGGQRDLVVVRYTRDGGCGAHAADTFIGDTATTRVADLSHEATDGARHNNCGADTNHVRSYLLVVSESAENDI